MQQAHVDITRDLDGEPVVHALFDLSTEGIAAVVHALGAVAAERYRLPSISADQVLELRELTTLVDELGEHAGAARTVVLRPARLSAFRDALAEFVEPRDEAEWISEEDREPLAAVREMLWPLSELSAETLRSALLPSSRPC